MISTLSGILRSYSENTLIVEIGGIGLQVLVPSTVFDGSVGIGQLVNLHTHLAVREDSLTLYGFSSEEQRSVFEALLGVSGIGPRLALSVLSTLSPEILRNAIAGEQPEVISTVPGVGRKTAEKIVFHLKDKFGDAVPTLLDTEFTDTDTEVLAALTALGYSVVEAQGALQSLSSDVPDEIEERIRSALQYFS